MPDWDGVSWPLAAEPAASDTRAALLARADEDARALGFDPAQYRHWLEAAAAGESGTGRERAGLAHAALEQTSLPLHVHALLEVSQARRLHAPKLAEPLSRWSDAELRITTAAAQARFDDPLSRRNRLAMLGRAAGTLGHELRNPIGVIQSSVYLLQRRPHEEENARRHIEKIGRQAGNCHRIIEDLMHLARNAPPRLESLDAYEVYALAIAEASLPAGIRCRIDIAPGLRVHADPGLLRRALVNVICNASTAMRGAGELRLGATESEDTLALWVRDHGPGFDPQLLRVAFDPLSTTSGIGLGLALVDSITRRHGGWACAENVPDGGARVSLHFPRPGSAP